MPGEYTDSDSEDSDGESGDGVDAAGKNDTNREATSSSLSTSSPKSNFPDRNKVSSMAKNLEDLENTKFEKLRLLRQRPLRPFENDCVYCVQHAARQSESIHADADE